MTLANYHGSCQFSYMRRVVIAACMFLASISAVRAAEVTEEIRQDLEKGKQQEQMKELQQREQIEQFKRDQQLNFEQRQLDTIKQQTPNLSPAQPQAGQVQQQIDQMKNDQQLQRMQNDLQLDRARRETNPARRQEQIREIQRQQQLDVLQEQNRKVQIQQDLDRLRHQQQNLR